MFHYTPFAAFFLGLVADLIVVWLYQTLGLERNVQEHNKGSCYTSLTSAFSQRELRMLQYRKHILRRTPAF